MIVLAGIALAVGMVELSVHVDTAVLSRWPRIFGASADGSRSLLSAIAGSMITVAGVTFSITIVAVTQASSQYTSRVLRNFMRDRGNQIVLGSFVGIFAYCLVVLRTIRSGDEQPFVPSIAVLLGVLLAIVGVAVLIYFVHHIATTLQAAEIVARISRETINTIDRLYPEELQTPETEPEGRTILIAVSPANWRPVPAPKTGYLQRADIGGLGRAARKHDLVIRLEREVGTFVIAGGPVAWYAPHPWRPGSAAEAVGDRRLAQKLGSLFTVSTYRTIDEDAAFGIRQLVDVAVKALSPGINDTTTAVTCIDYLGAILSRAASRRVELPDRDTDGVVRLIHEGPTFESLLHLAFDEIRWNSDGKVGVLARQMETLATIARSTSSDARRAQIGRELGLIHDLARGSVAAGPDREYLDRLAAHGWEAVASRGAPGPPAGDGPRG